MYLTDNIFLLQAMIFGHELSLIEVLLKRMCGVMTIKKGCNSLLITELSTLWYAGYQLFFFLSYYFLEFNEFIFYFHDTYNSRWKERYMDNPSTYSDIDLNL